MDIEAEDTRYSCVVGHEIPAQHLERDTEMQVLDQRLEIRLCREHGTPIAITRPPGRNRASAP